MLQLLNFDQPIPSCAIHALNFEDGKWKFIYAVDTPFEITEENDRELIIYEYISDLQIRESKGLHPESINIKFKTLSEYMFYINRQIKEDNDFRRLYLINHPDAKPSTIELKNKNYQYSELKNLNVNFIASIMDINDSSTIFAAI